ncbi:hypothetical protein BOTBODRAFT_26647 [Botryobasidium botryosum FD-172 SS1]|uniref:Uncharacterized protein n=1 Tax=Botryobasidium botryosum (strain FD-172 SS1) TaxID=930990 RepID=A0A067MY02_BOTB1|nr:hypothetical protein BOTBODRAFT_26647 [Botryobasidium botryosum FD-172 SS1]
MVHTRNPIQQTVNGGVSHGLFFMGCGRVTLLTYCVPRSPTSVLSHGPTPHPAATQCLELSL